ncbi:MAG: IS66 family transposase, partial [Moorea sp. SIO2I5]|nr:IS66 family transposase [Moorena sp. SIO2I5]
IEEQLKQNSQNSSRPPSSDGFGQQDLSNPQTLKKKKKKKKKKSSSDASSLKTPKLYPLEACSEVHSHVPDICQHCGEQLSGLDEQPLRHQIVDIPPLSAYVIEHQLHQLECSCCGRKNRAPLPAEVPSTGYGDRLAAVVAWLSVEHRQSHRMVKSLLATLFSVELSRGSINRIRHQVSEAVASPVEQAQQYVQGQAFVHSDETSFSQGNGDGLNPRHTKGWLWVLVTPLVIVFSVVLSRSQATAKALLGEDFKGILISDRYSAYNWLEVMHRQVCWAHLKRDLTAMAERSGVSKQIGEALLRRERRLFRWWHRVRDGTMSREQFVMAVEPLRIGLKTELEAAAAIPIANREKSPLAKTVRTARELLKLEAALWTFVYVPGVEPTNNAAERALRTAVIWRRTSFGSQSQAGSEFVSRILTVVTSLKAQQKNPLDYLTQAIRAQRLGLSAPSLLPQTLINTQIPMVA